MSQISITDIKQQFDTTVTKNCAINITNITNEIKKLNNETQKLKLDDAFKIFNSNSPVVKNIKELNMLFKSFKFDEHFTVGLETFNLQFENTGKWLKSIKSGVKGFNDVTKEMRESLSATDKVMIGMAGAFDIFDSAQESFSGLFDGTQSLEEAMVQLVIAIAPIGIAMYAALGPIGLVVGAIAAIAGAMAAFWSQAQEQNLAATFDEIGESAENMTLIISSIGGPVMEQSERLSEYQDKISKLNDEYKDLSLTFDVHTALISDNANATKEHLDAEIEALRGMVSNVKESLTITADTAMKEYTKLFNETNGSLDDQEREMLLRLKQNYDNKKKDVEKIEKEIETINRKASGNIKKLTEEDKKRLEELRAELAKMAQSTLNIEEIKQKRLLTDIKEGKILMTEANLEQFLEDIPKQQKEAMDAARNNYATMVSLAQGDARAEKMAKQQYDDAIKSINDRTAAITNGIIQKLQSQKEQLGFWDWGAKGDIDDWIKQLKKMTQGYASGGFPSMGQMFIAREAGPELVGTIGSRTAVANNYQIEEGIARAVTRAMNQASLGGNWIIQLVDEGGIKSETIISAAERRNRRDGRTIIPLGV